MGAVIIGFECVNEQLHKGQTGLNLNYYTVV